MKTGIFAILIAAAAAAQPPDRNSLAAYLDAHYQTPEDYVAAKFKDHDLVFLGEAAHGVRQNLLFLHKLIPHLYKADIVIWATR